MNPKWKNWLITLLITFLALLIMQLYYPVPNILKLQLAQNPDEMNTYILKIDASSAIDSYHRLLCNTIFDYVFLFGYSLLTVFSLKILLDVFDAPSGSWIWVLSFATPIFDIFENNILVNASLRQREDFSSLFYYIVRIKWALAIFPIMIILIVSIYGMVLCTKAKQ